MFTTLILTETTITSNMMYNEINKYWHVATLRPLCNVDQLKTYDAEYFGYISKGGQYSGFGATGFSDMLAPRSTDEACKTAFIKNVQDMNARFDDMVAVAYTLLERVRPNLQTEGGIHMCST